MSPAFRWIVLVSLVVKVGLALAVTNVLPRYDEVEFLNYGRAIYEQGAHAVPWRAPGYQWFVAAGLYVAGGSALGVRLLQVLLSVGASIAVYRIGRRTWGERAGILAGGFVAFYPEHVAFSHLLWSETLYVFLVVLSFERLLAADERGAPRGGWAPGLCLGAAAVTRSVGLVLLAASVLWLLLGRGARRGTRLAATLVAAAALVILPWSILLTVRTGHPAVIDTNSGFNLWSGNNEQIPEDLPALWSVGLPLQNGLSPEIGEYLPDDEWKGRVLDRVKREGIDDRRGPEGDRWFRARALAAIRADPGGLIRRAPKKMAVFWAPDFFLARHLVRDWYGRTPPTVAAALVLLAVLASAVPLIVGPAALAAMRRSRFRSLTLLWVTACLLVHAVAYGHSRMHQPLVPMLVLAVAGVVAESRRHGDWRRVLARGAPWSALALMAWLFALPTVGGLYLMPGPRHAGVARVVGAFRGLPLAGSHRLAWMLAGVEASAGRTEEANRILREERHAELPWSLYLRARIAASPLESERLLRRALEKDATLFAAWFSLARLRREAGDRDGAERCLARAREIRPWQFALP